jgi:hypothetical protein
MVAAGMTKTRSATRLSASENLPPRKACDFRIAQGGNLSDLGQRDQRLISRLELGSVRITTGPVAAKGNASFLKAAHAPTV